MSVPPSRFLAVLFSLALSVLPGAAAADFDQSLTLQDVHFHITSASQGSHNKLRVVPSGRIAKPVSIDQEITGTVTGAEIADLNADGWPEIYIYVSSTGSGAYGSVIGYAVNRGKSVTPIYCPDLADDPVLAKGYRGHDAFAVIETTLARRFPLYREGDSDDAPSGGLRQLGYRLQAGEAGWVLRLDKAKMLDFPNQE